MVVLAAWWVTKYDSQTRLSPVKSRQLWGQGK